jgi:putative FmdB family regulatory protein
MPTYVYECGECLHSFEVRQSIKDDSLIHCESCKHDSLRRVLQPVHVFAKGEPQTLGHQAARNAENMGSYELQEKRHAIDVEKAGRSRPKATRPWWRQTDKVNTKLAELAPKVTVEKGKIVKSEPLSEKAKDYIMTGKQ